MVESCVEALQRKTERHCTPHADAKNFSLYLISCPGCRALGYVGVEANTIPPRPSLFQCDSMPCGLSRDLGSLLANDQKDADSEDGGDEVEWENADDEAGSQPSSHPSSAAK